MKHLIFSLTLVVTIFGQTFAQNDKSEVVDAVANNHYWLSSIMVDNFVNLNLSKDFWDKMMKEQDRPMGIKTLSNTGTAIAKYLDEIHSTTLHKMCGFSVNSSDLSSNKPICEDQIKENLGKINVTYNTGNIRLTEDSYKLFFMMGTTVNEFLSGSNYNQSTGKGWKPKGKTMSIIINSGKIEGDLGAKWNADFTVCTITTSPYIEVAGWSDKILNVLKKGVTI